MLSPSRVFVALLLISGPAGSTTFGSAFDFTGRWVGKWDDKWCVQFTISSDPGGNGFVVIYQWEEYLGQPLRTLKRTAVLEGPHLSISNPSIDILLTGTPNEAVAIGNFSPQRNAALVRNSDAHCEERRR